MCVCRCGHRAYAGYVAEADSISARLGWLTDRVRAGDPAPAPELMARYRVWSPAGRGLPAAAVAGRAAGPPGVHPATHRAAPSVQTLLLGLGAVLLVLAGAVFAAVVWDRLGAVGQVVLMLSATVGVGALAVRLHRRLPGTAEALAIVAAGLAVVDLVAAPLLGLFPEHWVSDPTLYLAVAFGALAAGLVALGSRFRLRAWIWLGWLAAPVAAACVVPAVAAMTEEDPDWVAAAVAVPALVSVGLLAVSLGTGRLAGQRTPMVAAGGLGLAFSGLVTASTVLSLQGRLGALLTTTLVSLALLVWWWFDRRVGVGLLAAPLSGVTLALLLTLPADPQPIILAAVVAAVGLVLGLVASRLARGPAAGATAVGVLAAASVWVPWVMMRAAEVPEQEGLAETVQSQVSLLGGLVAVIAYVLAIWLPWTGWVGAVVAVFALSLVPAELPPQVEVFSLPFAALLLLSGLLWRRRVPSASIVWLGPAVAVALIPSALACWSAPWALGAAAEPLGGHLVRGGLVLLASVVAVIVGARQHLGGLLVPGSFALALAAGAQIFSGLANLPRWIGLGLAGVLLVLAGARIEWLRREGRRARAWLGGLR